MPRKRPPTPEPLKVEPPAAQAPPNNGKATGPAELRLRLQTVRNMMVGQWDTAAIVRHCRDQWGVARGTALKYVARVHERLAREGERDRPYQKQKIVLTTQRQVQLLMSANDRLMAENLDKKTSAAQRKWNQVTVSRNNQVLVRAIALLADLTGAREPVKVELGLAEVRAFDRVLQEMSPEKLAALRARQHEMLELAQKARVLLRLPDGTEVQGR